VSAPSTATVEVLANGKLRFTPNNNLLGTVQFQYMVSDNDGRPSAPTNVSVLVVGSIYQNPRDKYDVDNDGSVSPLDVLALINLLNASGPSVPVDGLPGPPDYVDVNGDNQVDPIDALEVINYINGGGGTNGEGEGGSLVGDSSGNRAAMTATRQTGSYGQAEFIGVNAVRTTRVEDHVRHNSLRSFVLVHAPNPWDHQWDLAEVQNTAGTRKSGTLAWESDEVFEQIDWIDQMFEDISSMDR
jgi:hypothetical protein